MKWIGITISPSYVGEPECNGVAERFMRTLSSASTCIASRRCRSARAHRRLHRPLQRRVAHRAARAPDPGARGPQRWRRDHGHSRHTIAPWPQDRRSSRAPYRDIPLWCPGNRGGTPCTSCTRSGPLFPTCGTPSKSYRITTSSSIAETHSTCLSDLGPIRAAPGSEELRCSSRSSAVLAYAQA